MEPIVNQVLLIGDKQPYVTALITINATAAESLKGMEEFKGRQAADLATSQPVAAEVSSAVKRINKQLAPFEQIRRFRILEREFSIDRGEITPTMKVRRKQVIDNYKQVVSELFARLRSLARSGSPQACRRAVPACRRRPIPPA